MNKIPDQWKDNITISGMKLTIKCSGEIEMLELLKEFEKIQRSIH